ncbi:MAG: hypothetical protein IKS17_00895 [Firmicutes bacterium]|nr:hypothetical protein [Bacillota bacterium]
MDDKNSKIKIFFVLLAVLVIIAAVIGITVKNVLTNKQAEEYYSDAISQMEKGNYLRASELFEQTMSVKQDYKDTEKLYNNVSSTLELTEQAKKQITEKNYADAIKALNDAENCSAKKEVCKSLATALTADVKEFAKDNEFAEINNILKGSYKDYTVLTNSKINEIEEISSSLAEQCADHARKQLESRNYWSYKNTVGQLKEIDKDNENISLFAEQYKQYIAEEIQNANAVFDSGKGDIDEAEKQIKKILEVEEDNEDAQKLSDNIKIYKEAAEEVQKAETEFNSGNYESALNTINAAFTKSEMAKNNYTELYNKINTARENEIAAQKKAEEEAQRAKEEAEREAAKNRKTVVGNFGISQIEAWYDGDSKWIGFWVENVSNSTWSLFNSDFYLKTGSGDYRNPWGIYEYDAYVQRGLCWDAVLRNMRPGEKKHCVARFYSDSGFNSDGFYFKDTLITTIN